MSGQPQDSPLAVASVASLPPPVVPGARVGVAALSGPVDQTRLETGLVELRRLGFQPVLARNLAAKHTLFAGTDAERLEAFHELAEDRDLGAIVFARGGHGMLRILDRIDWDLLASRPRAYVGYSDLTPFLLTVAQRLGVVAFHGPMVATDFARGLTQQEAQSFLGALAGRYPTELALGRPVRSGESEGVLLGGCLTLLGATAGTEFFPRLRGGILFLEDVGEHLYRLDRALAHLRLAGALEGLRGLVFGHLDWVRGEDASLWDVLCREGLAETAWPIAQGLAAGHLRPNLTLPLGSGAALRGMPDRLAVGILAGP